MAVASVTALVVLAAGCTPAPGGARHDQAPAASSPAPSAPAAPSPPPAPAADPTPAAALPALIAGLDNPQCQTTAGLTSCRANGFVIKLRPGHCASDGAYGTVGDGYLLTLPDGEEAAPRVELKGFHFACSVATATRDTPEGAGGLSWEYVVLPPTDTVQTCQRDAKACQTKPGAGAAWQVEKPAQACAVTPAGDYVGDCPAGWISTDDFGDFGYSQ
jgi:hypothetical protein